MELSQEQIGMLRSYFSNCPVLKAYLFGSFARKTAKAESDVDILVELDYSQRIGLKWIKMKLDIEELLSRKVDMISSQAISEYIAPYIENEKELIYERKDRG
ncbi:MAG: nucleotidyltransferase domain-containing protein [Candidatus Brocadiae bacterium]|nr:nucleotidyltransferase domain-containing protein [Candidatus Brocadiia bacterium]